MSIDGSVFNPDAYPLDAGKEWIRYKIVEEEKVDSIKFKAHVWKVGTLGTGGLRVQLNLDQEFIKEMAMLAECQHELIELEFEVRQSESK